MALQELEHLSIRAKRTRSHAHWARAGLPEIHFHHLRHTGNNLTATAGASLSELMTQMGHSSTRAALVYLHDTDLRQRALATAVSELAQDQLGQGSSGHKGTTPEPGTGT
jgi:integrase